MLDEFNLNNTSVLVTGGGRDIGKAMALVLAEAGADAVVAARSLPEVEETATVIRSMGRSSLAIQADVRDFAQVGGMVKPATECLGQVDVMVNNAGVTKGASSVVRLNDIPDRYSSSVDNRGMGDESWYLVLEANLFSAFYCCRAVARQMLHRLRGKIINISSMTGGLGEPYYSAYDSSVNLHLIC